MTTLADTAAADIALAISKMPESMKADVYTVLGRRPLEDSKGVPFLEPSEAKLLGISMHIQHLIHDNPKLTDAARNEVLEWMKSYADEKPLRGNREIMRDVDAKIRELEKESAYILRAVEMVDDSEWMLGDLILQRADGSCLHKLAEEWRNGGVTSPMSGETPEHLRDMFDVVPYQTFVVEHNFAAAFAKAKDFDGGEISLPFEHTAFEFKVSGRRVILCLSQSDHSTVGLLYTSTKIGWMLVMVYDFVSGKMVPHHEHWMKTHSPALKVDFEKGVVEWTRDSQRLADLIGSQVRAIAITLEAEVTTTEVIRAPHKLNRARERRGQLPLYDYHVVSLARRSRPERLPVDQLDPNREIGHRRLHFRRGHWRHYENHKVWIKWMLVGDPELGWVDKHYKL